MSREIVTELERIRNADPDGILHPSAVVDAARPPGSPLHDQFTWNDGEAARRWRLQQAHKIIRVSVTVQPADTRMVRAFVSVGSDRAVSSPPGSGGGYRSVVTVMSDAAMRAELLAEARTDINTFRRKYSHLSALAPVIAAMTDVLEHL